MAADKDDENVTVTLDDTDSAESVAVDTISDTQIAVDEKTVEELQRLDETDETVDTRELLVRAVENAVFEAIALVKEAYNSIATSLGADLSEEAIENDCKAYIKSKIKGVDDRPIECLNGVGRGSDVSVSYKICLVADKRNGSDFAYRLTGLIDAIAELLS